MTRLLLPSFLLGLVSGCSNLPEVNVVDDLADRTTVDMVSESVWVVSPEDARRFEDPAWPAPIQIVPPERDGSLIDGIFDVKLFNSAPSGQRIDVLYVVDGEEGECSALLSLLGVSASESAWIEVDSGGGYNFRCASVLINAPGDSLNIANPFMSGFKKANIVSMGESSTQSRYPIRIEYLND
jgi:hypothetical protein